MVSAKVVSAGENIHASCVCYQGRGLLIRGPSGAGKSTLALQLIALGAQLVADDRCDVFAQGGGLMARAPATLAGLIEAHGMGILHLPYAETTQVVAALDLGETAHMAMRLPPLPPRLPPPRSITVAGVALDFLYFQKGAHFPSLIMCYLMGARHM